LYAAQLAEAFPMLVCRRTAACQTRLLDPTPLSSRQNHSELGHTTLDHATLF